MAAGLDSLAVDLDQPAPDGVGGLAAVLEEADVLEPEIDAVAFVHAYNRPHDQSRYRQ
jgi:hypothetical protein